MLTLLSLFSIHYKYGSITLAFGVLLNTNFRNENISKSIDLRHLKINTFHRQLIMVYDIFVMQNHYDNIVVFICYLKDACLYLINSVR